ncbi:lysylphosphatidylglycerol synthase transmembrane domain-containing protein [uncultured Rhodospira sp.]|uniref:lysylphosphatidylglycerol synthase transmembrane domain-containing protein n=1 Tax=uncultured Rhodospira sp. TaxID=1936189 RepID=UPI002604565C|nr:lysylphosphatidylglycerol synthase transmembrane domain-containing protein [uncultured Rhodospira sp.]
MKARAAILPLLKAGVSLGLLGVILASVDLRALWARLDADVALAGGAALLLLQVQAVGAAARWRLVLSVHEQVLPFTVTWRNVLLGLFGNQAMPSTIGGDALRVWNGWRLGLPLGLATRSLIVDRVFSFLGLILLCVLGLPVLAASADDPLVARGLLTLVLGGLGCLLVLLGLRWLPSALADRAAVRPLVALSGSAWRVLSSRRALPPVLGLMLLPHLIDITVVWLYALALGTDAAWTTIALVFPPAILTAAVPVSVAGWGLREGALVLGFGIVGLPADAALACSLLYGASAVVTGLIGGGVWALGDADGLAALRRARTEAAHLPTHDRPP